jgi:O-antigen ligase
MKIRSHRILTVLCIAAFAVTAATSIPLFILYLRGETAKIAVVEGLHVWFGIAFVVFALLRIALNREFVAGTPEQPIGISIMFFGKARNCNGKKEVT